MNRATLTVLLALLCVLAAAALWWGWRNRARRQTETLGLPPLPIPPVDPGEELAEPLDGLYVSTTPAGKWQDRLVVHGLGRRARTAVRLYRAGVLVDRVGEEPIFIPAADLTGVATAPGIAGKVMGMAAGILVLTWQLGGVAVDSGIKADDLEAQQLWLERVRAVLPGAAPGVSTGEAAADGAGS